MWGDAGAAKDCEVGGSQGSQQKPRALQRVVKIARVGGGGGSLKNLPGD